MPKFYLSPSGFNTFKKCPRQFYYSYIKKLKVPPNVYQERGRLAHKVVENFYSELSIGFAFHSFEKIHKEFKRILETLVEKEFEKIGKDYNASVFEDAETDKNMIKQWMESFAFNRAREYYELLQDKKGNHHYVQSLFIPRFQEKMLTDSDYQIRGIVDAVYSDFDHNNYFIDYKTSKFYAPVPNGDVMRQLDFYSLLLAKTLDMETQWGGIHYLKYDKIVMIPTNKMRELNLLREAQALIRMQGLGDKNLFPREPVKMGSKTYCTYCDFAKECNGHARQGLVKWET